MPEILQGEGLPEVGLDFLLQYQARDRLLERPGASDLMGPVQPLDRALCFDTLFEGELSDDSSLKMVVVSWLPILLTEPS